MRCKSCHYSLANLTSRGGEHRCPECGRAFDPGDPATFKGEGMSDELRLALLLAGLLVLMVLVMFALTAYEIWQGRDC